MTFLIEWALLKPLVLSPVWGNLENLTSKGGPERPTLYTLSKCTNLLMTKCRFIKR